MRETDIIAYAHQLLDAHGGKAEAEVAAKVRTLDEQGDADQAATWRRIRRSPNCAALRQARSLGQGRLGEALQRAGKRAAVEQQVLAGNVAGVAAAKEGAGGAELGGVAEAAGRVGLAARLGQFLDRAA